MKFIVERNWIDILGEIWWPYGAKCSLRKSLSAYDIENIRAYGAGEITREAVDRWLCSNSGDFSKVIDFYAVVGDQVFDWSSEENMLTYLDTIAEE